MKTFCLILIPGLVTLLCAQNPNEATLTFVNGPGKNQVDVDLDVSLIGASDAISTVSGTMQVKVNISPVTGKTNELTILSANAAASNVNLSKQSLVGRYNLNTSDISFDLKTLEAPGIVDPETGEFNAAQHQATTSGGTVAGTANITFPPQTITVPQTDLSNPPLSGSVDATGTITVTPGRIEGRRFYYDLTLKLPIGFGDTVPIPDAPIPIEATVGLAGQLEATGETFLEYPDYATWATDCNLPVDSENDSDLQPDIPNYLLFALGFDDENMPGLLFEPTPGGVILKTASPIALGDVEIQWSDDMITWTRVPSDQMITGDSLMTFRDPIGERPTVSLTTSTKYLRLARPSAP